MRWEPTRSVLNWTDLLITGASAGCELVLFRLEVVGRTDGRGTGRDKTKTPGNYQEESIQQRHAVCSFCKYSLRYLFNSY